MVSPMLKSGMPEKTTISPADASSIGALPAASKLNSSPTLTCLTFVPGPAERPMGVFFLSVPEMMRPMPRRPMKGSEPMLEICNCNGLDASALGFGRSIISLNIALMSSPIASMSEPAIRLIADV